MKKIIKKIRRGIYNLSPTYKRTVFLEEKLNAMERVLNSMGYKNDFLHPVTINNEHLFFYDNVTSSSVQFIADEFKKDSSFNFNEIDFKPGDVVIDIGGNIGIVSIFLARKFPFLKIYAFEPAKRNYDYFLKNLELHNITNVIVENKAVTKDGRNVELMYDNVNTGGSTMSGEMQQLYPRASIATIEKVPSITLDEIFDKYELKHAKLLKIDCEGAEYEILYNTNVLKNIDYIRGEIHEFDQQTKNENSLMAHCKQFVSEKNIRWTVVSLDESWG